MRILTADANARLEQIRTSAKSGDLCVVTDFDNTLTGGMSPATSKSVLRHRGVDSEYGRLWTGMYNYYRFWRQSPKTPMEERREQCRIWYDKIYRLYLRVGVTPEEVDEIASDPVYRFRPGWPELLRELDRRGIPIFVVTCGFGNLVKKILQVNGCDLPHVTLLCNSLKTENGRFTEPNPILMTGLDKIEGVRTALQSGVFVPRGHTLVCGDLPTDFELASLFPNPLRVGFSREGLGDALGVPKSPPKLLESVCDILLYENEDPLSLFSF